MSKREEYDINTQRVEDAMNCIVANCKNAVTLLENVARAAERFPNKIDELIEALPTGGRRPLTVRELTSYDFEDWFSSGLFPVDEFVDREPLYQSCIKYMGDDQITRRLFMEWMVAATSLNPLFHEFDYCKDRKRVGTQYLMRIRTTGICD